MSCLLRKTVQETSEKTKTNILRDCCLDDLGSRLVNVQFCPPQHPQQSFVSSLFLAFRKNAPGYDPKVLTIHRSCLLCRTVVAKMEISLSS